MAGGVVAIVLAKVVASFFPIFKFLMVNSLSANTVNVKLAIVHLPAFPVNLNQPRSLRRSHA